MRRLNRSKKYMLKRRVPRRRKIAPLVAFILLLSLVVQTFAFTPNTPKEEVIYVNLKSDGSVDGIFVVNSFDLNEDGQIIDYGDYTSFRELTQSGQIKMEDETITIDAGAGKVYYEGKLREESIPWNFEIKYYLDGKEYKGEALAGESGELRIDIDVTENPKCDSVFFKNLTLQVGLAFNDITTKDIKAEGAVIANAGKNKQIMFNVLPNRESSFAVTAHVSDFEMDGITINGMPMNMDFDIEDDPEINDELKKLKDGVAELDDGAVELRDGVKELRDGTEELRDGVEELSDGTIELADGTEELRENIDEFVDGTEDLDDGVAELQDGTKELKEGTEDLDDGVGKLASGASRLRNGASELAGGLLELKNNNNDIVIGTKKVVNSVFDGAAAMNTSLAGLSVDTYKVKLNGLMETAFNMAYGGIDFVSGAAIRNGVALAVAGDMYDNLPDDATKAAINAQVDAIITDLANDNLAMDPNYQGLQSLFEMGMFYDGLVSYTNGVAALASGASDLSSGVRQLYRGLRELDEGTADLREGVEELHDGVVDLKEGTVKLVDGAIELRDGVIELDDGVIELKDGVLELFDGAIELHDGVIELHDGTIEMAKGTMEFRDKTADLEKTFKDKIKEKLDEMLGRNFKPQSFVSEKNINIDSVQFVMKTADILIEEIDEPPTEPTKQLSFIDRLLALFRK